MDIRHPLKDSDLTLLNWCEETNTSVLILLNKSDKISKNQSTNSRNTTLETLKHLKINTNAVVFSAKNHQGIDFLKKYLIDSLDLEGSPNALG
jgi:GTP-binding protein